MRMRRLVFWLHLASALFAGLLLVPMSLTGAAMAFERPLTEYVERDARSTGPALAPSRLMEAAGGRVRSIEVPRDPERPALVVSDGRALLLDVATGATLRESRVRAVFGALEDVHRTLGFAFVGRREVGTTLTGLAAIGMATLATSGLVLWWPRGLRGERRARALAERLRLGARRPAESHATRDWRFHHVFGIWSMAVLLTASLTGIVLGFEGVRAKLGTRPPTFEPHAALDLDGAFAEAQARIPEWRAIRVKLPPKDGALQLRVRVGPGVRPAHWATFVTRPGGIAVIRHEDGALGDRVRGWSRWLHTGQALGTLGPLAWMLAALSVSVLAYTGYALAWRRWRRARTSARRRRLSNDERPRGAGAGASDRLGERG